MRDSTGSARHGAEPLPSHDMDDCRRFGFGANWRDFLTLLDETRIREAERSLAEALGRERLDGVRFLDVGCGSGLFSLAARRLGALVRSFDFDKTSVACTAELRDRFFAGDANWIVERGDVLDESYMSTLRTFDVIYAWGVLHHTGQMWRAMRIIARNVAPGGKLWIAIYNDEGWQSWVWWQLKRAYNALPPILRPAIVAPALVRIWGPDTILDLLRGRPFDTWRNYHRSSRGMSAWHDVVDWVGGYPYEVARPEQVIALYETLGFAGRVLTHQDGHGCNEFILTRRDRTANDLANAEVPTCVACGGQVREQPRTLRVGRPLAGSLVRSCSVCGTAQVSPMPTPAALERFYSADYYRGYAEGAGIAGGSDSVSPHLRRRLAELTGRFGRGRVLDLGCAHGVFLAHARDVGWTPIGIETSAWAAAQARRRYGLEIYETPIESAPIAPQSMDVVHANHVLEHLIDPVGAMRAAFRLLRPGGVLVAEVPQELFTPFAEFVLRRRSADAERNYHLAFFSRSGLALAARRAGFVVERIENVRHLEGLRYRSRWREVVLKAVYAAERLLRRGPAYVVVARRPR